jgi:hypothetical protein
MENLPYGLGILIGMDVIGKLGGMRINKGVIEFDEEEIKWIYSSLSCTASDAPLVSIKKHNFEIEFKEYWSIKWNWKSEALSHLPNRQSVFKDNKLKDVATLKILDGWVEKGYLIEYHEKEMGKYCWIISPR